MMKQKIELMVLCVFLLVFSFSGCKPTESLSKDTIPSEQIELTILAAASLKDVTEELTILFQSIEPNVKLVFSYGGSGALQTQIEEGAPADLFFSAATKQMDALSEKGLLLENSRKDLLINKIVLITPKDSTLELKSFEDVSLEKVKMVALGEPTSVPVGQYSEEVFTYLSSLDLVQSKANYGSDVRQVLTWVETGEVECGVVYATDANTSDLVEIVCEAPEGSHKKIVYPVAVLKSSKRSATANAFVEFLTSEAARMVFEKAGFTLK